ncbi:putative aminopeptidase YsdC, partial [Ylistrum balloti]|uniref:putative aminopeptidase YsdC n=1 Tax=Ylistrum balloti TaxID=509963 RepID=UPI002905A05F
KVIPVSLPSKPSLNFLKQLIAARGPSGFEAAVQQTWVEHIKDIADQIETDYYGNCWATLKAPIDNAPTIVVTGHADEIGLMVNHIETSGLLRIVPIGGIDPTILSGRRIKIQTDQGELYGVIGSIPIHLQNKKGERKPPTIDELFIDCGFKNGEEAAKQVRIGNIATIADNLEMLGETRIVSRATDNRIGIYSAAETLQRLAKKRHKLEVNVIALSTIQEEIGLVGAQLATRQIKPDLALVVDVTHATDIPGISQAKHGKVEMGKGPTITHGTSNHPRLVERIMAVATTNNIPLQHEASSRYTGTDTDAIYKATTGIPSALISLPNRYMHTPSEVIDLEDLESLVSLLTAVILDLKKDDVFCNINL